MVVTLRNTPNTLEFDLPLSHFFLLLFLYFLVTGEGHKTLSVLKRGLSRVEMNRTLCPKTLELRIVQKLKK